VERVTLSRLRPVACPCRGDGDVLDTLVLMLRAVWRARRGDDAMTMLP
jgi:hypothetical protein